MEEGVLLEFNALPSVIRSYPAMFTDRSPSLLREGQTVPPIEARIDAVCARPEDVEVYAEACGFPADNETLPLTYPHVLAMPLHMAMLSSDAFPVRIMGLVHVANRIKQYRRLDLQEVMSIHCRLEGHRDTDKGQEFDLETTVIASDQVVWEEVCTFLARRGGGSKKTGEKKPPADDGMTGATVTPLEVPSDIGRRYGKISGDLNPIHLFALSAKLFGFPRAIAHGMWSMARVAAEIEAGEASAGAELTTAFKLPILLPSRVLVNVVEEGDDARFLVTDEMGEKPHLTGLLHRD